jgi:hypothetical protein
MTCFCRKCLNQRAGPFELIHKAIVILCKTCGSKDCPRAKDCDQDCTLAGSACA